MNFLSTLSPMLQSWQMFMAWWSPIDKFIEEFTSELYKFSKIHQYDHRKDFKEAWNIWVEDNQGLVDE